MKIFIGYDSKEHSAYEVCRWSMRQYSDDLDIVPLIKNQLPDVGKTDGSTEFTYTRFLVPYLTNYQGWALFCDCDFLWQCSPTELLSYINDDFAVLVVQHPEYQPKSPTKMSGQAQSCYPRKNWSSLILWNCEHPSNRFMTPTVIRNSDPGWLHQFKWLQDQEIGSLPKEYNWLVGYYHNSQPRAIHYTDGGPWLGNYQNCEYAGKWSEAYDQMTILNRSLDIPK
jgi:hypothetical protein